MQKKSEIKFKFFDELQLELQCNIAQKLSTRELVNFSMTSTCYLNLFQPLIDVRKLLHHVTRGEHDAVKAMLKKDMSLIFKRGVVADCSGREFESISAFEYALWALDKHMWAAMIACIPQNEEGRKVFEKLIAQYNKVKTDGVTYKLNGKTITEQHFDFENTLIKELQTQVDLIILSEVINWGAVEKQWREGVGGAQKLLPMHIVYEYCSNERFYPVPKFDLPPNLSNQFYNWITSMNEGWFSGRSKLGSEFAIYKGSVGGAHVGRKSISRHDLDAMKALCEVRTLDLINLKSQLEEQAGLENHYQVVPMRPS